LGMSGSSWFVGERRCINNMESNSKFSQQQSERSGLIHRLWNPFPSPQEIKKAALECTGNVSFLGDITASDPRRTDPVRLYVWKASRCYDPDHMVSFSQVCLVDGVRRSKAPSAVEMPRRAQTRQLHSLTTSNGTERRDAISKDDH
jgi:hypothetical protein